MPGRRARAYRRIRLFIAGLAVMTGVVILQSGEAFAGTLTNVSWAVSNNAGGATGVNYSYSFKTATTGTIKTITFTVSGGTLAGAPTIVTNYGIGAGTVARAGNVITYTVTAAVSISAGIPIFIEFGAITNMASGTYTTAVLTQTAVPATIDGPTNTQAVTFASTNTAKTIVVAQSTTFTLDTTAFQLNMDPTLPALADQSYTSNLTVFTNANSGYTVTVADSAAGLQCTGCTGTPTIPQVSANMAGAVAWPSAPANASGYSVTGTGVGDAGFSVNAAFSAGAHFAGYRNAGDVFAQSTTGTGATANTLAVQDQTAIDYATSAGTYTDTITYTVTPNYN